MTPSDSKPPTPPTLQYDALLVALRDCRKSASLLVPLLRSAALRDLSPTVSNRLNKHH